MLPRAQLDALMRQLAEDGITAAAFPADVSDRPALTAALEDAAALFGPIDVLEFSPHAGLTMISPQEVTVDSLRPQIEEFLYGAVTATQTVLSAMLEAGAGTLLFTLGGGALNPYPMLAATNAAHAALRNWAHNLHNTLADKGIHVATVPINLLPADRPPKASRTGPRTTSRGCTGTSTPAATSTSSSLPPDQPRVPLPG